MFSIAPVQVAIDTLTTGGVIGVVRVVQAEAFEGAEMCLDSVEPTGIGWRRNESDLVGASKRLEGVMPMRGEIILNEVDAGLFGITRPQPFPGRPGDRGWSYACEWCGRDLRSRFTPVRKGEVVS